MFQIKSRESGLPAAKRHGKSCTERNAHLVIPTRVYYTTIGALQCEGQRAEEATGLHTEFFVRKTLEAGDTHRRIGKHNRDGRENESMHGRKENPEHRAA